MSGIVPDTKTLSLFGTLPVQLVKRRGGDHMKDLLLRALNELGEATVNEAAEKAGLSYKQASKRMSDLAKKGKIVKCGERRRGYSRGAMLVNVWKIK